MLQDCTGTSKRLYLVSSIKAHLDKLDDVELAVLLYWLKSGGIYREPMLATLEPQKIIDKAEEISRASQAADDQKRAEADAKRAEGKKTEEERWREHWKAKIAAAKQKK